MMLAGYAVVVFNRVMTRPDGRQNDQLRPISFVPNVAPYASGSVLVSFGDTRVICSATIEEDVPRWMRTQRVEGGWLTAEYSMLPYSTLERKPRDISRGKLDGRSSEIQRLIGRALRACVDLKKVGQRTIWIDCDVLQADGGTRTASISGGCVALAIALNKLMAAGKLKAFPIKQLVAAVSAGVYEGVPVLDLNYPEDKIIRDRNNQNILAVVDLLANLQPCDSLTLDLCIYVKNFVRRWCYSLS